MGGWKKMKEWHFSQCYHTQIYLVFWCSIPIKLVTDFKENLNVFTKENIETIEKLTMDHCNEHLMNLK